MQNLEKASCEEREGANRALGESTDITVLENVAFFRATFFRIELFKQNAASVPNWSTSRAISCFERLCFSRRPLLVLLMLRRAENTVHRTRLLLPRMARSAGAASFRASATSCGTLFKQKMRQPLTAPTVSARCMTHNANTSRQRPLLFIILIFVSLRFSKKEAPNGRDPWQPGPDQAVEHRPRPS